MKRDKKTFTRRIYIIHKKFSEKVIEKTEFDFNQNLKFFLKSILSCDTTCIITIINKINNNYNWSHKNKWEFTFKITKLNA